MQRSMMKGKLVYYAMIININIDIMQTNMIISQNHVTMLNECYMTYRLFLE